MLVFGVIVAGPGAPNGFDLAGASCFAAKGLTAAAEGAPKTEACFFALSNGLLEAADDALAKGFIVSSTGESGGESGGEGESSKRTCLGLS